MHHRRLYHVILTALFCLVGLSIFTLAQAQPIPLPQNASRAWETVELLTNTSFEIDNNGDKIPDVWTGSKTGDPSTDKLKCNKPEKVVAYTGNCAFMFKGNPDGSKSKLKQDVTNTGAIVDTSILSLSAYVDQKSGIPDSKIASAKVKFSDGSSLKLELRLPARAAADYALITTSEPISLATGVSVTEVSVDLRYEEDNGKLYVDDATLIVITENLPTPPTTQLPFVATQLLSNDG